VLWAYYKSIKKATRIASQAGTLFGWFLVFSGLISMFRGGFGLWYILLGGFLVFLAKAGYEQVIMKESLSRVKLQDLVTKTELCQPSQTIDTFMRRCEEQSLCYGLVRQKNRFFVIDLEQVARLPREAWNKARVRDIMRPVEALSAEQDPFKLFYIMRKENLKLVPIVRRGKYLGIVTEETIMNKMRVLSIRDSA
jgi:signal-transduction protein with cAMP-binding, CBS, and nucleotidyltransferase domain